MDELTVIDWELGDTKISSNNGVVSCKQRAENGDTEAQRILSNAFY